MDEFKLTRLHIVPSVDEPVIITSSPKQAGFSMPENTILPGIRLPFFIVVVFKIKLGISLI